MAILSNYILLIKSTLIIENIFFVKWGKCFLYSLIQHLNVFSFKRCILSSTAVSFFFFYLAVLFWILTPQKTLKRLWYLVWNALEECLPLMSSNPCCAEKQRGRKTISCIVSWHFLFTWNIFLTIILMHQKYRTFSLTLRY